MKLTAILLMAAALQVSANGHGQGITLSLKNASLEKTITEIEKQSGYSFVYGKEQLALAKTIDLTVSNEKLESVLDLVFKDQPLTYTISGKYIAIRQKVITSPTLGSTNAETPPPIDVKGRVVNENGEPVIVTVTVKGTSNATSTDASGYFTLLGVDENAMLVISGVTVETREIKINGKTDIGNVVTKTKIIEEEAVTINAGYYKTTEKTSTGNISKVTAKEIAGQPVSNPLQALQGRMTGVEIVQKSGVPGASMQIIIRGENSLRTVRNTTSGSSHGNLPLYIIDGVPVQSSNMRSYGFFFQGIDPLNTINPENIESIEILKDADATAIYGSRAANGVVLITTKKGKTNQEGGTNLEVSFYQGAGKANQISDMMNSKQYLAMRREAFKNDNVTPTISNARDLMVWDTTRYTDWQDVLFGGTANITDAQIALSGGNSTTSFRFGVGYHKETLVFPGDFGYNRKSGSLGVNHKSKNEKFKGTFTVNYGFDNNDLFAGDMINAGINLAPVAPALYDKDGNLNWEKDPSGSSTWINPLASTLISQNIKSSNLITNAVLSYEIFSGVSLRTNLGYTSFTTDEIIKTPLSSFDPTIPAANKINVTTIANRGTKSWIVEPQLIYKKTIGRSKLDLLLGSTWQSSTSNAFAASGYGYASDDLLGNLGSAATVSLMENTNTEYKYTAFFGRIGYSWSTKYLINLTARRDGSSRFGPNKKFANFGAVGLGWVFSKEGFVANSISFLNFGKLRASYGTTGSDAIGDFGYLDAYGPTTYTYQGIAGLIPFGLSNPDYAWEINKKLEVGLELGFIKDRILFSGSWYRNRSSNQLVGYPLPIITGFTTVIANLPATVQNTGLEFTLNSTNIQSNGFRWVSSLNLTIPRNKLISYPNIEGSSYSSTYVVGEPLNIARVFTMTGVNPQTGLYQFEDVNSDGSFTIDDRTNIINLGRKYFGGINNTVSFKGFELSFLFEFVKQKGRNEFLFFGRPGGLSSAASSSIVGNQLISVLDRWVFPGNSSNIQKFSQTSASSTLYSRANGSNIRFSDASFVRLKTISIGYDLPVKLMERVKLKNCRIYLQGQNLLTLTKYVGLDPQNPGQVNLPALRMITGGIQCSF